LQPIMGASPSCSGFGVDGSYHLSVNNTPNALGGPWNQDNSTLGLFANCGRSVPIIRKDVRGNAGREMRSVEINGLF